MQTQAHDLSKSKISKAVAILESIDSEDIENLQDSIQEKMLHQYDQLKGSISDTAAKVQSNLKVQAKQVDESAHNNPWKFIGAAAALAVATGFLLGSRRK